MLKVSLPDGQVGTVQAYVAVQHVIFAIILIDNQLVSADISQLTAEKKETKNEQSERGHVKSVGRNPAGHN